MNRDIISSSLSVKRALMIIVSIKGLYYNPKEKDSVPGMPSHPWVFSSTSCDRQGKTETKGIPAQ